MPSGENLSQIDRIEKQVDQLEEEVKWIKKILAEMAQRIRGQ